MELFRGYVPTRNKQCLEKFKGVEKLKTRSEVQDLDEYAGILGEETILMWMMRKHLNFCSELFRI